MAEKLKELGTCFWRFSLGLNLELCALHAKIELFLGHDVYDFGDLDHDVVEEAMTTYGDFPINNMEYNKRVGVISKDCVTKSILKQVSC